MQLADEPSITRAVGTSARRASSARNGTGRQTTDGPQAIDQQAELNYIYDFRRNCLLNELYYGRCLARFSTIVLALEIAVIVGSGTSGVSGWLMWTSGPELKAAWGGIAALSTLVAAIKPAIQIDRKIHRYGRLFSGYRELSLSMATILEEIAQFHRITPEMGREIARLRTRYKKFAEDDDPQPSMRLVKSLQDEVSRRIPCHSLWYPTLGACQQSQDEGYLR